MKEELIRTETYTLAKEKGFDIHVCRCGGYPECICEDRLPTQSLLQKWLREKHRLHVKVEPGTSKDDTVNWHAQVFTLRRFNVTFRSFEYATMFVFADEYEECLEKGLISALNLIASVSAEN